MKNERRLIFTFFAYVFLLTLYACWKHYAMNSGAFDLGIFSQVVHNLSEGRGFESSLKGMNLLADHFSPVLVVYAPFYSMVPSPYTLIVLQSILLFLPIFPLLKLSKRYLSDFPKNYQVLPVAIYFFSPFIISLFINNFHPESMLPLLLLLSLDALDEEKWLRFMLFSLALFFIKEDMLLINFGLGLFIAFYKNKKIAGLSYSLLSLFLFFLIIKVIIPSFKSDLIMNDESTYDYYTFYSHLGANPKEIIKNVLLHPWDSLISSWEWASAISLFFLFFPFLFKNLMSLSGWWIALPHLMSHYLSSRVSQFAPYDQYLGMTFPALIYCFLVVSKRRMTQKTNFKFVNLWILLIALFGLGLRFGYEFHKERPWINWEKRAVLDQMIRLVPQDRTLCTDNHMAAQFSNHRHLWIYHAFTLKDDDQSFCEIYLIDLDSKHRLINAELAFKEITKYDSETLYEGSSLILIHLTNKQAGKIWMPENLE